MTNDFPFEIFTVKNSCFTSIHNYINLVHFASDGISLPDLEAYDCLILSDHCIIVPHLNDK